MLQPLLWLVRSYPSCHYCPLSPFMNLTFLFPTTLLLLPHSFTSKFSTLFLLFHTNCEAPPAAADFSFRLHTELCMSARKFTSLFPLYDPLGVPIAVESPSTSLNERDVESLMNLVVKGKTFSSPSCPKPFFPSTSPIGQHKHWIPFHIQPCLQYLCPSTHVPCPLAPTTFT
jgi:hypothetical protein